MPLIYAYNASLALCEYLQCVALHQHFFDCFFVVLYCVIFDKNESALNLDIGKRSCAGISGKEPL